MQREGFPKVLKQFRGTRRLSQEQLAFDAGVSTRHLSYLETGKSNPSREMVLQLGRALDLELRDRNLLLEAAGFLAAYSASPLDSLELAPVRRAVDLLLDKQEPFGALLLDRCWNVLKVNRGAETLLGHFMDAADAPPAVASNMIRAALHPAGLRPAVVNWPDVAAVTLERIERECAIHPHDAERRALRDEVRTYPGVSALSTTPMTTPPIAQVHLRRGPHEVRLFTMLTTLGTPLDVTAQDLALESFFPADPATEAWFSDRAAG